MRRQRPTCHPPAATPADDAHRAPSARGPIRVSPPGPVLDYATLDRALSDAADALRRRANADVLIDFGAVEQLAAPWTPVFAKLIEFARHVRGRCVVAALHGQPAEVAAVLKVDQLAGLELNVDLGPPPAD